MVAWYVDVERVASWHPAVLRRGKRTKVPVGQEVLRDGDGRFVPSVRGRASGQARPARPRRELAELGVEWLASQWGLVTEPMLPDDFEHLVA